MVKQHHSESEKQCRGKDKVHQSREWGIILENSVNNPDLQIFSKKIQVFGTSPFEHQFCLLVKIC